MTAALRAGLFYFLIVFAIGFGLGTLRTIVIAPRVGDVIAVGLELPLMLGAAWQVCRRLVDGPRLVNNSRRRVASAPVPRLVMGGTGFALLMATEFAMAVLVFGQTPTVYAAFLASPAGMLGLAGQVAFALMPLVHHAYSGAQRRR